jgi:hypothetical protein
MNEPVGRQPHLNSNHKTVAATSIGLSTLLHGDNLFDSLNSVRFNPTRMNVRVNKTWTDSVHSNSFVGNPIAIAFMG